MHWIFGKISLYLLCHLEVKLIDLLQIRDSNRAMILAAAVQQQCKVLDLGIARDDEDELERILDTALSAGIDILLTSGGVSMGDKDFVKPLLAKRGTVYYSKVDRWPILFGKLSDAICILVVGTNCSVS